MRAKKGSQNLAALLTEIGDIVTCIAKLLDDVVGIQKSKKRRLYFLEMENKQMPLGDRVNSIEQLDDYRTEAIDILFHLSLNGPNASPARIVQDVLNEAFDLSLSLEECMDVGRKISRLVADT